MDEILDKNTTRFGKNPALIFGQTYLIIEEKPILGKVNKRTIPLSQIKAINYTKSTFGKFVLAIFTSIFSQDFPDYKSFLEIAYVIDGEDSKVACNGRFNKNEIKEMKELIFSRSRS